MTSLRDIYIDERSLDQVLNSPERSKPIGFILRLAKALHTYGVPAYELEKTIELAATQLGYGIQCMSLPTSISITFMHEDDEYQTFVTRVAVGEINLEKLRRVTQVAELVIGKEISPEEGANQLKEIEKYSDNFNAFMLVIALAIVSGSVACIFGGGITEICVSLMTGGSLGALLVASSYWRFLGAVLPTLASLLVFIISHFLAYWVGGFATSITIVSGLIVLLPGLTLTIAMAELATQNLVSGTARLMGSAIVFLQLGLGLIIGNNVFKMLSAEKLAYTITPLPEYATWIALVIACLFLIVPFNARVKDAGWLVLAGVTAFSTSKIMMTFFSANAAAFVGAVSVGIVARIVNERFSVPGAFISLPGILLLVPGSVGFRSIESLVEHQVVNAFQTAFDMAIIGLSLVSGLLVSSMTSFRAMPETRSRE